MIDVAPADFLHTPLHALHLEMGAKMVPFAGHEMPIHYQPGILGEHIHTRNEAGLFDVSHMGQVMLRGDGAGRFRGVSRRFAPNSRHLEGSRARANC